MTWLPPEVWSCVVRPGTSSDVHRDAVGGGPDRLGVRLCMDKENGQGSPALSGKREGAVGRCVVNGLCYDGPWADPVAFTEVLAQVAARAGAHR